MNIELSNGLFHFYQWDTGQQVKAPDGVETIHFRIDNDHAAPITVVNGWATVPDECFQSGDDLVYYAYDENHTTDSARVEVVNRPKPDGYAYTPTEVKTWESLDARIKALEKGGGVAGVSSVNGQTGAVTITAEGLGALTEDNLQSATNAALAQAKASGEFDGAGLDVTGATVGQTVKISAVDAEGKPTAWEPVDMASGSSETWELINEVTLSEDVMAVVFDKDKSGAAFALRKFAVVGMTKGSNASNTGGGVICINVANTADDKYSIVPPVAGHGALKGDQIRYWNAVAESFGEKGWRWYLTGADNTWKTNQVNIGTGLTSPLQTTQKVATYLALWSRTSGSAFAAGSKIELYGVRA